MIREYIQNHANAMFFLGVVLIGLSLLGISLILTKVEEERNVIKKYIKQSYAKRSIVDDILDTTPYFQKLEETNKRKYAILGDRFSARKISKIKLFAALMGLAFAFLLKNMIMVAVMTGIAYMIPDFFFDSQSINKKNKIQDQLGLAIKFFISEYTTSRSVIISLQNIIPKLPHPIRYEFERLTREFNSGGSPKEALESFALRVDNKFSYIFSRLLMSYFDEGTDFGQHLVRLSQDISEDQLSSSEGRAELAMVKMTNYIINGTVAISLIVIFIFMPERAADFQATVKGQIILAVAVGLSILSLALGLKLSDS